MSESAGLSYRLLVPHAAGRERQQSIFAGRESGNQGLADDPEWHSTAGGLTIPLALAAVVVV